MKHTQKIEFSINVKQDLSKFHALHFISSNTHNFNCIGVSYSTFKMHFDLITAKLSTPDKHIFTLSLILMQTKTKWNDLRVYCKAFSFTTFLNENWSLWNILLNRVDWNFASKVESLGFIPDCWFNFILVWQSCFYCVKFRINMDHIKSPS